MDRGKARSDHRLCLPYGFLYGQHVLVSAPFIIDIISYTPHEVTAEATYLALLNGGFKIRQFDRTRIKGNPIVLNAEIHCFILMPHSDLDPMLGISRISVRNDIGEHLLHGKIDLEDAFLRQSKGCTELFQLSAHRI